MQPRIEDFTVVSDAGEEIMLRKITPFIRSDNLAGSSWTEGLSEIFTADGRRVNSRKDGTYFIVGPEVQLRRPSN